MKLLPRYLKAIAPFISRDETRAVLTAVHLTPTEVVATDSYRMVRIGYEGMDPADYPRIGSQKALAEDVTANVDGKTFIEALSSVPARTTSRRNFALPILRQVAVMEDGDHFVTFGVTDLNQSTLFVARKVEGQFPAHEQLWPDPVKDPPRAQVALNARFLADMAKAAKDFGSEVVHIEIRSSLKPVMFSATNDEGGTFSGLQMPVRWDKGTLADVSAVDAAVARLKTALTAPETKAAIKDARDALDRALMGKTAD